MSGFELNKLAAAILLAGLVALLVAKGAEIWYPVQENPEKRGYQVEVEEEDGDAVAGAAPKEMPPIATLLASANLEAGQAAAKKCAACHSFEKGGANKVGPNLWDIVGAKHAHTSAFAYSDALKAMHDKNWGYEELAQFIHNPRNYAKGTKMAFAGIKKPEELANVIFYMRSLSDNPKPLPAAP